MGKHKTRNKLSKLKIKHNELLTISLSEKKLRRYKNKYDFLIAVPFLLCVIHFTAIAPMIVNVSPVIGGIIGGTLILSNVIFPICYANYKANCEAKLKNKTNKIAIKIDEYEKSLNIDKRDPEVVSEKNIATPQEDILFQDFPELHITEETRQAILEHPELHSGLSVRARIGKIYTDEEWEQRREEVLSRPLPGEEKTSVLVKKKKSSKNRGNK